MESKLEEVQFVGDDKNKLHADEQRNDDVSLARQKLGLDTESLEIYLKTLIIKKARERQNPKPRTIVWKTWDFMKQKTVGIMKATMLYP